MEVRVINVEGRTGRIPIHQVNKALGQGYTLENPDQEIRVINPEGKSGRLPLRQYDRAMQQGYTLGEQVEKDSLLNFGLKGISRGIANLAGTPNLIAQGVEGLGRMGAESKRRELQEMGLPYTDIETPQTNALSSKLPTPEGLQNKFNDSTGIDLETNPQTLPEHLISGASEFVGSAGPFGWPAKAAKGYQALKAVGNIAGVGATSGAAQYAGAPQLAADLGASVVNPSTLAKSGKNLFSAFANPKDTLAKIPLKMMGLSPKNLDLKTAQAARDLGVDLPAAALTDSTITGLADQWVNRIPFFNNKLKNKYATTEEQTLKALEDIYNKTGPSRTSEVESKISNLYNDVSSTLPKDAKIIPTHLKKALDDIKINTSVLSPSEKSLLDNISVIKNDLEPTSKLFSSYGNIKAPIQPFDVNRLVGTKKSLNSIIKWDTDEGVKNQLRTIQKAISKDISEYGKTNPEWYSKFKEADNLFSKVAKREKLESLIPNKGVNSTTDKLSYDNLSKSLNNAQKQGVIKKQVDPETLDKIQKLAIVAQTMAKKTRNVPNPSWTAMTAATVGVIGGLLTNPVALLTGSGVGTIIGARAASQLLTDKKFIDNAIKLAENPNKANLINITNFNKRIKEITGYSAVSLNRELQRAQQKEEK
jgi:hypothetical protein